jgi:hypothetical protein
MLVMSKEQRTTGGFISILISACSVGFTSASLSFDYDCDPAKRQDMPKFYGYIRNDARFQCYTCLMVNSMLLLLIRSFTTSLLIMSSKMYFVYYAVGEWALYILYKLLRRDFTHWIPLPVPLDLVSSMLFRTIIKIVVDYTGVVHFRHPYDLGGAYWTANMFFALAGAFISLMVYYGTLEDGEQPVLQQSDSWTLVCGLCGAWLVVFGLFFRYIDPKFKDTFISLKTGFESCQEYFESNDEETKMEVFSDNRRLWSRIEPELRQYLSDNWERWELEQPEWFTDRWRQSLDDDMLPAAELRRQKMEGGGQRRKSSVGEILQDGADGPGAAGRRRRRSTSQPSVLNSKVAPLIEN